VTGNFFSVLGVTPVLGRGFSMEETWKGASDVVILGHGLWRRRFGADPGVIGRRIQVDAGPRTVVGVAPEGFHFPSRGVDLWVPFGWDREGMGALWFRRAHFLWPIARLRPARRWRGRARGVARNLGEYPETNRSMGAGATRPRMDHGRYEAVAPSDPGVRGSRAPGRLRQRRGTASRARDRAVPGDGGSRRARGGTPAARSPASFGEPSPRRSRWIACRFFLEPLASRARGLPTRGDSPAS
jgi:hypothetical protein